jgi:hypothetical protein
MPELYRETRFNLLAAMQVNSARTGSGAAAVLVQALRRSNLDSPVFFLFRPIIPRREEDRRALLQAIGDALERNPSKDWRKRLTEWSEKLRTQAATSES